MHEGLKSWLSDITGISYLKSFRSEVMSSLQEVSDRLQALEDKGDELIASHNRLIEEVRANIDNPQMIANILDRASAQTGQFQEAIDRARELEIPTDTNPNPPAEPNRQ